MSKSGRSKTFYSSGRRHAPEAKNTAPAPSPAKSIAGYSKLKAASKPSTTSGKGTGNPSYGGGASGYGHTGKGAPKKRLRGGNAMAGSSVTKSDQGTCCPSYGSGPSGLGRTGRGAPGPK